jgi:hypothetical protein
MANLSFIPTLTLGNQAAIANREGARAQFSKNGFCPEHPDIQLRKKTTFGWKTVRPYCDRCEQIFQRWLDTSNAANPSSAPSPAAVIDSSHAPQSQQLQLWLSPPPSAVIVGDQQAPPQPNIGK